MRSRQLAAFLVILALLAGAAVWKKSSENRTRAAYAPSASEVSLGADLSASSVSKVEISRGTDEKLVLARTGGRWTLPSHHGAKARKEPVESFLNRLGSLRGEVRSEDEAVLGDFAITDEKAIHLRIFGEGGVELAHFLLSSQRPRGTVNFVRRSGSSRVIATSTDLLADLGIFSDNDKLGHPVFSDLRPAGVDSSKVASFELAPPGGKAVALSRKEDGSGWTMTGESAAVNTAKVNEFFAALYNLYASAPADPASGGFGPSPWARLNFKQGETPSMLEIFAGPKDAAKGSSLWKVMPDGFVYEIPDAQTAHLLKKDRASFLADKAAK